MCSFEWIGLHFKAIFRRLAGFERPENSPVDCFQRERAGRPPERWTATGGTDEVPIPQENVKSLLFHAKRRGTRVFRGGSVEILL